MPLTIGTGRALLSRTAVSAGGFNPSIVSTSTGNNGLTGTNTFSVTAPTSISSGNLLIAISSGSSGSWTPPTGWTQQFTKAASGNSPSLFLWTKTATGSEPGSYSWTESNGTTEAINMGILNISGANTTSPINQSASNYQTSATTAAVTIPSATPSVLSTLALAINTIQQLNPSNTSPPVTSLTSGWTGQFIAVQIDGSNPGNISNNNGYSALYVAAKNALTTDTTTGISAGWTWGGASSNFTGTSLMALVA
jgi:hypothetical protein